MASLGSPSRVSNNRGDHASSQSASANGSRYACGLGVGGNRALLLGSNSGGKNQNIAIDWCRNAESNRGPTDYESVALPTELSRLGRAAI
jgi:hypothetical protein